MSSRLISCQYCDRLYSQYSLHLHEPKCVENPNARRPSLFGHYDQLTNSRRPRTRSMSRADVDVEFRLCFVCGKQFDEQHIAQHERKCLNDWYEACDRLASRFEFRTPVPLLIPSVDGTYDVRRLNEHAAAQVAMAQTLRCRRCHVKVLLSVAEQHRCTRYEPSVELFY